MASQLMSGWEEMRDILKRVAIGPAGSKNLTEEEACRAMGLCLDRHASDIQIAVFLIAQRLKRETDAENVGFLKALLERSQGTVAPCESVANLGDPYDGFNRVPHFAPLVAAVTGACGLPTVVHGCSDMPPKHGVSHRHLLEAYAGHSIDIGSGAASVERAAQRAASRGAAYVDMEDFHPKLWALTSIRREIAKRPALSTLEKLIVPIRGRSQSHVVSGWVHKGYERQITEILRLCGWSSVLLFKGREGHIDAFAHRPTTLCGYQANGPTYKKDISPADLGINLPHPPEWGAVSVQSVCELWKQVLEGQEGPAGISTALTAAAILTHAEVCASLEEGYGQALEALSSGRAKQAFEGFLAN
ncbi:MAG TPA: hypothetical protein EYN06_00225 [Myxococcales bacterium]|nr:hypothetical protein [Myxococcales bacterium]HIN84874.1 hypothetical protein [Myxococcales bacterium]